MSIFGGFKKTADLDRNMGGNEYDRSKNDPEPYAANVGAAGVAPSFPPPYMPVEKDKKTPEKKKFDDALFIAQGKLAEGVGTQNLSDTDPGIVDQLKYQMTGGLTPEQLGYQGKPSKDDMKKRKFLDRFLKTAGIMDQTGKALSSLKSGLTEAGKATVGDTLKLKGLKHIGDAIKGAGGISNAVKTESGRKALAEGVGKAAPSLGVVAGYAAGAKKVYDKASSKDSDQPYYY
jgi:hypothetical protein